MHRSYVIPQGSTARHYLSVKWTSFWGAGQDEFTRSEVDQTRKSDPNDAQGISGEQGNEDRRGSLAPYI